ncbi:hypothetical protein [Cetobacterium sp.]|uniref:hypothetical protein n=1 Tax=Cetobacterium sp. TaxID=2071632 RepID=UPI003EE473FA
MKIIILFIFINMTLLAYESSTSIPINITVSVSDKDTPIISYINSSIGKLELFNFLDDNIFILHKTNSHITLIKIPYRQKKCYLFNVDSTSKFFYFFKNKKITLNTYRDLEKLK